MNHVNMRLFIAKFPFWETVPEVIRNALLWNGQNGVQIFFAISGFLITSTTLRRWKFSSIEIREFYWLRLARIAPLLLLLLVTLSLFHLAGVPGFIVPSDRGGLGRALFAALTFQINVLEARLGYLPPAWDILWSLSVEEVFYLCFPLACRYLGEGKRLIVLLCVLIALGPLARTLLTHGNETWREVSYLGGMDAIALGCLAALIGSRVRMTSHVLLCLEVSGGLAMTFILGFSNDRLQRWGLDMSVLALGTSLVIMAGAQTQRGSMRLWAPLRALGRRSYEIYLWHMFVVMGLFQWFRASGMPRRGVPVLFALVFILSGLSGALVAHYFSEPMNRRIRNCRPGAKPPGTRSPLASPAADPNRQ